MRAMSSSRVTSTRIETWPSSAASFSTLPPSISASTTFAPSPAIRRAVAAPMPPAAPVINTTRPVSEPIVSSSVCSASIASSHRDQRGQRGDEDRRSCHHERGGEARLEAACPPRGEHVRERRNTRDDAERARHHRQPTRAALLAGGKCPHHRGHVRNLKQAEAESGGKERR